MTAAGDGKDRAPNRCDPAGAGAWRSIAIGNYRTGTALHDALVQRGIHIGDLAAQMLRLPTFTLVSADTRVDLSLVTVGQLGSASDDATFAQVHAQAMERGLDLCPPEVGPQLRLQYPDQEVGEYLLIGMTPLPTTDGSEACFVVGNGGAGLLIVGRSAGPSATVTSETRFVFALRR